MNDERAIQRRAYVRRFLEGWSSFHIDQQAYDEPETRDIPTLQRDPLTPESHRRRAAEQKELDPRRQYVRRFAERWSDHHKAEEEGDVEVAGLVAGTALRVLGTSAIGALVWLFTDGSRSIQWIAVAILGVLIVKMLFNLNRDIRS